MANNQQSKIHTCTHCKKTSEIVGVMQTESHYYSLNINTNQLEDFHGDEVVQSQEFFCINCKQKINDEIKV
ncbi:MAG: hypothetical protein WC297_03640 [Candidatus Paceibacterota bacterium]|jgi:hypothetical protein